MTMAALISTTAHMGGDVNRHPRIPPGQEPDFWAVLAAMILLVVVILVVSAVL